MVRVWHCPPAVGHPDPEYPVNSIPSVPVDVLMSEPTGSVDTHVFTGLYE
jgi:hypothetical protein